LASFWNNLHQIRSKDWRVSRTTFTKYAQKIGEFLEQPSPDTLNRLASFWNNLHQIRSKDWRVSRTTFTRYAQKIGEFLEQPSPDTLKTLEIQII
jgi:hypothetical protein